MFFDVFYDLCKKKGVSCKKAAEEIGLSNSITTKWKKTGATPSGDTLEKVAAYFDVTADYLLRKSSNPMLDLFSGKSGYFTREEHKKSPLINDDQELTEYLEALKTRPEMRMLFQLSKDATKEDVEAAVRIIEALRNK